MAKHKNKQISTLTMKKTLIFLALVIMIISAGAQTCEIGFQEIIPVGGGTNAEQQWLNNPGIAYGRRIVVDKNGVIDRIGFYTGQNGIVFRSGVYTISNGKPDQFLFENAVFTTSGATPFGSAAPVVNYIDITPANEFSVSFGDTLGIVLLHNAALVTSPRRIMNISPYTGDAFKFSFTQPYANAFPNNPPTNPLTSATYTDGPGGLYCVFLEIEDCVEPIFGCMDNTACNYNSSATVDDASCEYLSCAGCTNASACNYDNTATINDGSCTFPAQYYNCAGDCISDVDNDGVCNELEVPGCTNPLACNWNGSATDDNGSCIFPLQYYDCSGVCLNDSDSDGVCNELEVPGCTNPLACNWNGSATDNDGSCTFPGCLDPQASNYNPTAGCPNLTCVYAGCTAAAACNYDPLAWPDDGSCVYPGCTDPAAANYDILAGCDNNQCFYTGCDGDIAEDGVVNIVDLMLLLSQFSACVGVACSGDMNADAAVNTADFLLFASYFGNTCGPE